MKKKGGVSTTTILLTGLVIFLIVSGILIYFTKGWGETAEAAANKEVVRNWVLINSKPAVKEALGSSARPPVEILNEKPIVISTEEQLADPETKRVIVNSIVDCWDAFWYGEKDFFEHWDLGLHGKRFCFVCQAIEFDDNLKGKVLRGLGDFMNEQSPVIGDKKYYEYIPPGQKLEGDMLHELNAIQINSTNYYVTFRAIEKPITSREKLLSFWVGLVYKFGFQPHVWPYTAEEFNQFCKA